MGVVAAGPHPKCAFRAFLVKFLEITTGGKELKTCKNVRTSFMETPNSDCKLDKVHHLQGINTIYLAGVANLRLFAWFHAAATFILKYVYMSTSLEFCKVFLLNALLMKNDGGEVICF